MFSATTKRLLASTSFRMALLCAGVVVGAFVLAALGTWLVTKAAAERTARERVQQEMSLLQEEVLEFGQEAAVVAIQLRARLPGAFQYRLTDEEGHVVAGHLPIEASTLGWSTHYMPDTVDGDTSPDFVILNQPLGGGYLAVAEDLEHSEWARYAVLRTLLWFAVVALLLSLAVGYLVSQRALRSMQEIVLTMERAGSGDFAARVPVRPVARESDLDGLGRNINAMLARVDALVRNLRRVSTEIAHDLRAPLTNVLNDIEAAASPAPPEVSAPLQSAQRRIEDLLRTFDAMLRLAEIEAGSARSRFVDVDLAALAERVGDAYRPDAESVGGRLDVQAPEAIHVHGDPHLLAQALSNLIENALKHGGERPCITVKSLQVGHEKSLLVQDDGPGIPRNSHAEALKPHVRLDSSRTSQGAGLGLSIVAAVAQLHQALLTLEDAKPGLCVKLAWPVS